MGIRNLGRCRKTYPESIRRIMLRRRGAGPGDVQGSAAVHVGLHTEVISDADAASRAAMDRRSIARDGDSDAAKASTSCRANGVAGAGDGDHARQAGRRRGEGTRRRASSSRWQPHGRIECADAGTCSPGLGADGMVVPAHVGRVGASQHRSRSLARARALRRRRDHAARCR
jgi:hypothetical protein